MQFVGTTFLAPQTITRTGIKQVVSKHTGMRRVELELGFL